MRLRFAKKSLKLFLLAAFASSLSCKQNRFRPIETEFQELIGKSRSKVTSLNTPIAESVPYFVSNDFHPVWTTGEPPVGAQKIGAFRFTDHQSQPFTNENFASRTTVAMFFFASCADYCPRIIQNIRTIEEAFKGDETVQFVAHTVTPEMDSPERLKEYAKVQGLGPQWHLLTGNRTEIYDLARTSYLADTKVAGADTDKEFIHSDSTYLIDGSGYIRGIYRGNSLTSLNDMVKDIRVLQRLNLTRKPGQQEDKPL